MITEIPHKFFILIESLLSNCRRPPQMYFIHPNKLYKCSQRFRRLKNFLKFSLLLQPAKITLKG
ncbi:hypothetical protein KL86APRO_11924 [uncultured Alphaproteobacteria bacterium]|uniref:Uncharacterized protein n=1 Tax=uncultured Alphaproteobacteria bacterium TaxID=91750 RepID=A0A212JZU1_9PROT|nr:hypothetical protein KL86APRO_11924 [uncultured Alphaproteobacteria bacterium]